MPAQSAKKRAFPHSIKLNGRSITLRLMQPSDRDGVLVFAQSLPAEDLLFLPLDITHPKVVDGWMRSIDKKRTVTVLAEEAGKIVGMGTLVRSETFWARHLGNMRLLVGTNARGLGLGTILANEVVRIAQEVGYQKIVAQMAADEKSAITVFEKLGFRVEALLTDYVIDRENRTHDLIVMSYDVTGLTE